MGGVITEEHVIIRAQYLDLFYSQMGTLYDLIHDSPHPSTNQTPMLLVASHVVDGVIGPFHVDTFSKQISHSNLKPTITSAQNATPPTPSAGKTSALNTI
jgi:hypothetical protein